MNRSLEVSFGTRRVGRLSETEESLSFAYSPAWLEDPEAFAVSLSLPLRDAPFEGGAAAAFFANLLPEGEVRTRVAERLKLSVDNDFALLAALGGDCAGALTLTEGPAPEPTWHYRPLTSEELAGFVREGAVFARVSGQQGVRLSLAGAQDKLPVCRDGDGNLSLPLDGSPSTHLLKFARKDFRHLPANEAFVTDLARDLGLPAVEVDLLEIAGEAQLLVERYDRSRDEDGRVTRLHQEDFCQALGLRPTRKYEGEGGPDFARCFETVADQSAEPALDTESLLRWLVFGFLVGNADGHAKNLSLLRSADGRLRLAPFYDLLSTAIYPALDRHLAMKVGRTSDPGEIGGRDWNDLAAKIGVRASWLLDFVRDMAEALPERAKRVAGPFRERYGDSPALGMILPLLRKRARRALHLLDR